MRQSGCSSPTSHLCTSSSASSPEICPPLWEVYSHIPEHHCLLKKQGYVLLVKFIIYLYFTKPQIWWGMTSWFLEGSAPIKRLSTRFADQFTEWVYKDLKRRERSGVRLWTVSPTTVGMEKLRTRLLERNYCNPGKKKTPVTSVMTQDYTHCSVLLFSFFSLQLYSLFP